MAATVALDGTNITTAESTTGWARSGTISAPVQESDIVLQGTYCVSTKASGKAGALYYDYGSGLNFTTTYAGQHIFMWIQCTTLGGLDTLANGSLAIRIYSTTANYNDYVIAGSDDLTGYESTPGYNGFKRFVIDPTKEPTSTGGTGLDLTSVRYFGVYIDMAGSSKSENLLIDRIDIGWGLRVYGTSTDGWQDVADADMGTVNNRYGIFQEVAANSFQAFGRIEVGDDQGTNGTTFAAENSNVQWVSQRYYSNNGDWVPMIDDDFFKLSIVGNSTAATSFTDGIVVGSGDTASGRNGCTYIGSALHYTEVDLYDGSNAANDVNLYGVTFRGMRNGISWGDDSDHEMYGCTIDQSGQFDPVGAPKLRNNTFSNTTDWYDDTVHAAVADNGGSQTDETTAANNATTNDMNLTPAAPAVNDAYYFGHSSQFNRINLNVSTADSGSGVLAWEYYNGSGWTALSNVIDETFNFRNSGENAVRWDNPSNWATTTVNSQGPYYYVRARVTTAGNQALGQQVFTDGLPTGSALLWNTSIDIKNCSFRANTDTENDPHAIQHDTSGTVTYDNLQFAGNDYDIHFTAASGNLTVSATNTANPSTSEVEGTGSVTINNAADIEVNAKDSSGVAIEDAQCFVERDPPSVYTSAATGNAQGDGDFVVQEALAAHTPSTGWLQVKSNYNTTTQTEQWYRYASKDNGTKTFTFNTKIGPIACTGGGTSTSLQDNVTTNFLTADIEVGDTVRNETDGSWAIVVEIVDADNITTTPLTGGSDNTWTSGDNYSFHTLAIAYDGADSAWTPWMNELSDATGDAVSQTNYPGTDQDLTVKVRKFQYKTFEGTGKLRSTGFSIDVRLEDQPNVNL